MATFPSRPARTPALTEPAVSPLGLVRGSREFGWETTCACGAHSAMRTEALAWAWIGFHPCTA